ncbi:MAG: FecR domain-containing protein, partial [Sedimentisphaerales bacterium]|nr:FecR domain-containing protein [Sedimentisphaerales bacterium]
EAFKTEWAGKVQELPQGSSIFENEVLCLNSGIIELETENEVNIIIEGPSEFQFKNNREINLNYGHLYSKVKAKGSGFMVRTADALIVDLGTEFSVKVGKNSGSTEIQMYKGLAAISGTSSENKPEIITSGHARSVTSQGELKTIPFSKAGVLNRTISAYEKKISELNALLYHTYNNKNSWVNNYIGRQPIGSDVSYSNTLITEPLSGKSIIDYTALYFIEENGNSYVSYNTFPVFESGSFTVAIWFKANQKVHGNTKQFLASRYDQQTNTGWRIGLLDNRPFMRISDYTGGQKFQYWQSHPEQIDEQWHSLVMVIDREKHKFNCYLDGKPDKWQLANANQLSNQDSEYNREKIDDSLPDSAKLVTPEPLYLGIRSNMMCQFEGWIYDIAIWDKALTSADIEEIYTKFP